MVKPFSTPPRLRKFEPVAFMSNLCNFKHTGHLSTAKQSRLAEIYKAFISSPNFKPWFSHRRSQGQQDIIKMWRQARYNSRVEHMIRGKSERDIIDLYLKIGDALHFECSQESVSSKMCAKLHQHLLTLMDSVPPRLQGMIQTAAERRLESLKQR